MREPLTGGPKQSNEKTKQRYDEVVPEKIGNEVEMRGSAGPAEWGALPRTDTNNDDNDSNDDL